MTLPDVLTQIVDQRRRRLGAALPVTPAAAEAPCGPEQPFVAAVRRRRRRAVIAEVKLGSPRLGDLRGRIDPPALARLYAEHGAAALSVVVEPDFFFGSYELLARCRNVCDLPVLAKDFLVHPAQVERAKTAGADAVLLVAALYDREGLRLWANWIRKHGMVPLVETHGDVDVRKLARREWELVGVNNRDLRTFDVDLERSLTQLEKLPPGCLKIAESGIRGRQDLDQLAVAGFDAFLIGESLLLADDPATALRRLVEP